MIDSILDFSLLITLCTMVLISITTVMCVYVCVCVCVPVGPVLNECGCCIIVACYL